MYLHVGQNEMVPEKRILGIFDLDQCSCSRRGREYLEKAEAEGVVLDLSGDLPRSFVVCDHPYHRQIVYLSQLNTSTLAGRAARAGRYEVCESWSPAIKDAKRNKSFLSNFFSKKVAGVQGAEPLGR